MQVDGSLRKYYRMRSFPIMRVAASIALVAWLGGCATPVHVSTQIIDESGDISGSGSYRWDHSSSVGVVLEELPTTDFNMIIHDEIDLVLQSLGLQEINDGPADITMGFRLTVKQGSSEKLMEEATFRDENYVSPYGIRWRFNKDNNSVSVERATARVEITLYQIGTLHLAAFDKSGQMSWHVSADKIINERHTTEEHESVVRKMVRLLMRRFPETATNLQKQKRSVP